MKRIPGRTLLFVGLGLALGCPPDDRIEVDTGDTTPPDCEEGTVADGDSCVPEACGVGTWGDLPVDGATVYVDVAAAGDGDGSADAPFTSIQAGLDAAGAAGGGLVAVAAGTYGETLSVTSDHAGVSLAGRCAELVLVDASTGIKGDAGLLIDTNAGAFEASGIEVYGANFVGVFVLTGEVTLRGVKITENLYSGLYVSSANIGSTTTLLAEDCEIAGNFATGAHFEKTRTDATLRRVTVRDSQYLSWGLEGAGVAAIEGATLRIEDSEIADNRDQGVLIFDDYTTVEIVNSAIHGTQPDSTGFYGQGIQASAGATLTVDGCELYENTHAGITIGEDGTTAVITDTVIRDTQPTGDGEHGSCLEVGHGASVTLQRGELHDFRIFGIGVTGEDTQVLVEDSTVRDAIGTAALPSGLGAFVSDGGALEIRGSTFTNVAGMGVASLEEGSSVLISDSTILGTRTVGADGQFGIGLAAGIGGSLEARGCELIDNGSMGVLVSDEGSLLSLDDVLIQGTGRGLAYTVGVGVAAVSGGEVSASALTIAEVEGPGLYAMTTGTTLSCDTCTIQDTQFAGAVVEQGAALILSDSEILDTTPASNVGGGVGVWADTQDGETTRLELLDSAVTGNPIGGVWLSGPGSYQLQGNDLQGGEGEVRGSLIRCGDAVYARDGVSAWDGERGLVLEDNTIREGHGAGLFLDDASATLAGNDWDSNTIDLVAQGGACAQAPDGLDDEPVATTELCPTWDYSTCGDEFELYLELASPEG